MDNDEIETIDSTNDDEVEELDLEDLNADEKAAKLEEQNKKLYARAKTAEERAKKSNSDFEAFKKANSQDINNKPPKAADDDINKRLNNLESVEKKRQFGHKNELSPDETDKVFHFAQGAGIDPTEALKDSFVQSALKAMRAQRRAEDATPSPSRSSVKVDGKTFADMNETERRKNFDKISSKFKG